MRQRVVTFIVIAVAIISTAQLLTTVLSVSPYTASPAVLRLFFLSLFACLTCFGGIIWYAIRRYLIFSRLQPNLVSCIRQAGLVSLVIVLSLFFNSLSIFRVWDLLPLSIAATLIEFFFQADKAPRTHLSNEE